MRAIGTPLGIPDEYQPEARDLALERIRTEPGQPRNFAATMSSDESFAEFIDWRAEHPSDDLMTELLYATFEDETGTVRSLTKEETLTNSQLVAGGQATRRRTASIGSAARLSDHPDQRRELAADLSLVPSAIEQVSSRHRAPGSPGR